MGYSAPVRRPPVPVRPLVTSACLALTALAAAAPASAAPVFGTPVELMPGALVGVGAAFDGTLAVVGEDPGSVAGRTRLVLRHRAAASNTWGAPEVVADEPGAGLVARFHRNALGGEVAAWLVPDAAPGRPVVRVRVREGVLRDLGPVLEVPLPDRPPAAPGNENVIEDSRSVVGLAAAVGADGALALAVCDQDHRADSTRALLWFRPPGGAGSWRHAGRCIGTVRLGADARGGLVAMWTGAPDDAPKAAPRVVWVAERAPGATGFGQRRALSDPARDADNNSGVPDLLVTASGTVAALWNGFSANAGQPLFADQVLVARRDVLGRWGPPEPISGAGGAARPTLTGNVLGAVAVAWNGAGLTGSVAAPGAPFGAPFTIAAGPGQYERTPLALDATEAIVAARRGPGYELEGHARRADGTTEGPVAILPPGTTANATALDTDPFGNGTVVTSALRDRRSTVVAVPYSAGPPRLTGLALTPTALALDVGEPARVSVQVLAGRRALKVTGALAPTARRERVPLPGRVRALLRARGARVVVRARDAGPTTTTIRRTARALRRR